MNQEIEKYLQEVSRGLFNVSKEDREDILLEIKSHIHEATEKGESASQILTRLGSPVMLAKAYSFDYCVKYQRLRPLDVLNGFAFYGLAGFSGVVIIPSLCILAFTFLTLAAVICGTAVLNLIGAAQIPMFVYGDMSVSPGILQLALSLIVGAVFIILTWLCWIGLKKYVKTVSQKYYNRKLKKQLL